MHFEFQMSFKSLIPLECWCRDKTFNSAANEGTCAGVITVDFTGIDLDAWFVTCGFDVEFGQIYG